MDSQHTVDAASTAIETQPKKRTRRKTRLEKLAEAEQRLAQAQAEVDRLREEEAKVDAGMKIRFASWIIESLHGITEHDDDESSDKEVPVLIALIEGIETHSEKRLPKDIFAWIKTKA